MDKDNILYYIYTNFSYDNNILYEDSLTSNEIEATNNSSLSKNKNNKIENNLDESNISKN